ncbi:MAG: DMT family transporter [Actinomycetota bacterium]|nr:DMT family transporter [Actinomycetota bacterium]MDQ5830507.1 DMT family transporter [Actinomycetota bacterium]
MRIFGKRRFVVLAFSLLVLFWGSAFAMVEIGLYYSPPVLFAGLRTVIGGLAMVVAALLWGGSPNLRRDWPVFLLLALFNVVLFIAFQTYAIVYLPSGSAAVLVYLQPILVGFLAWLILGEELSAPKLVGLLLGFSGIVAVSSASLSGAADALSPIGVVLGTASALAWALGTVYFKRYEARVSTLWAVAVPFVVGGAALTALGLVVESWDEVSWTGTFVGSLLYSALIGISAAWVIWFGLVRAGEASRVAAYIFAVPLTAVLVGALVLDEPLSYSLLVGAALVVCGIYLVNRPPRGKPRR